MVPSICPAEFDLDSQLSHKTVPEKVTIRKRKGSSSNPHFFPKQVYLWGSILEKKNRLDTLGGRAGLGWARILALLGALDWVGRGVGSAGRTGWVGRGGLAVLGRAGWVGRGVERGGLAVLGALAGLGVGFKVQKYTLEIQK